MRRLQFIDEHNIEFSSAAASTDAAWNCELHLPIKTALKATTATTCYAHPEFRRKATVPEIVEFQAPIISLRPSVTSMSSSGDMCPILLPILSIDKVLTWLILIQAFFP